MSLFDPSPSRSRSYVQATVEDAATVELLVGGFVSALAGAAMYELTVWLVPSAVMLASLFLVPVALGLVACVGGFVRLARAL